MISKEERKEILTKLVERLLSVQRINTLDLMSEVQLAGVEGRLAVDEAGEHVRAEHGIDFGPLKDWPHVWERKTAKQTLERADRQRRASERKRERALLKCRLVRETAEDAATRELAARKVAKEEERKARISQKRRPVA